jgi:hypothetical protein
MAQDGAKTGSALVLLSLMRWPAAGVAAGPVVPQHVAGGAAGVVAVAGATTRPREHRWRVRTKSTLWFLRCRAFHHMKQTTMALCRFTVDTRADC